MGYELAVNEVCKVGVVWVSPTSDYKRAPRPTNSFYIQTGRNSETFSPEGP